MPHENIDVIGIVVTVSLEPEKEIIPRFVLMESEQVSSDLKR